MLGTSRAPVVERLPADTPLWFLSDLHLGDGTPSDVFFGKDRHLRALIDRVDAEGASLVVVGDALDFHQAWSLTHILRAHHDVLSAMSRLGSAGRLVYVVGNHDFDIGLYRQLLSWRVCDELHVGDQILVQHGYQYDPLVGRTLDGSHLATKVHHLVERWLNTWIRIPLGEFYTRPNRVVVGTVVAIATVLWAWDEVSGAIGLPRLFEGPLRLLDFWSRSNSGDPMCIFRPAIERLRHDKWPAILCGHSHLPGKVRVGDRWYVNTGSWTFGSAQYVVWDGSGFTVRDWLTGREYGQELYVPLIDGTLDEKDFWQWWRENHLGWLRFREGEEKRGKLRGWQTWMREAQARAEVTARPRRPKRREPALVAAQGTQENR